MIRGGSAYRQSQAFKTEIRERDSYTCQLCGKPGYEVDHIVPYATSKETKPDGVRILCVKCNRATRRERKDANHLEGDAWYQYLERELSVVLSL